MSRLKKILRKKYSNWFHSDNEPSVLIVGAQKSGTSSLHYYLSQHPDMVGSRPKEVGFFHRDIYFGKTYPDYRTHFRGPSSKIYFESTPEYLIHPGVAENIYKYLPKVRLIVLMRNPVSRAYSAWNHYLELFETGKHIQAMAQKPRREGNFLYDKLFKGRVSFPSFRECLEIELEMMRENRGFEPALIRRGLYLTQLEKYWSLFPKEQIKCIGFSDLIHSPAETLADVAKFIGVGEARWTNINYEPKNSRQYRKPIDEEDRDFLQQYYREPNEKLFSVIGEVNW